MKGKLQWRIVRSGTDVRLFNSGSLKMPGLLANTVSIVITDRVIRVHEYIYISKSESVSI